MKKSVIEKANQLKTMHVTDNPFNQNPDNFGFKYFIEFDNTYTIVGRYRTQNELEEGIEEILRNGYTQGSSTFY